MSVENVRTVRELAERQCELLTREAARLDLEFFGPTDE